MKRIRFRSKWGAFWLGVREYRMDCTRALRHLLPYYETGREWAHRLTLRRFDH